MLHMFGVQIRWLERLIQGPAAQAALAKVPESVPKDAASWLTFCIQCGRAGARCTTVDTYQLLTRGI